MKTQAETLGFYYNQTWWVIERMTAGLTHADSLLQPNGGNCLNWVLGHLITERDTILGYLGQPALLTEAESEIYRRESAQLQDETLALPLELLLRDLASSQASITSALATITPEALEAPVGKSTVGERIAFKLWHETYHVGQLELLRHLAGMHDSII